MAEKVSHAVAQYGPGHKDGDHCAICTMYRDHHCTAVVDPISPMGWCRFFEERKGAPK